MIMVAMVFGTIITVKAQKKSYVMWESLLITPNNAKLKVLGENMRKHNQKYHKDGPYKAYVYNITTGPNTNKMVWMMGPLTFSDLDARPAAGGHDADWRDNIMPYVWKLNTAEYWKQDGKLSNVGMMDPTKEVQFPIESIRYYEVAKKGGQNTGLLLKQISKTVKAMDGVNPFGIYDNQFRQGDLGRHIALVGFNKNWAEFDKDDKFKETFIKVNGKNSWQTFLDNMNDTFTNSWDEIWTFNPMLSGHK